MQGAVTRFALEKKNGLMLIEMPTGSGKTYQARKIIAQYIRGEILQEVPSVFYVSPLIKNVDDIYNDLRDEDFKDDLELLDSTVLRLYPNAECVVKYLGDVEKQLPAFITNKKSYKELKQQVDLYNQVSNCGKIHNPITCAYLNNIRKTYEPPFRKDVVRELEKVGKTKKARRKQLQSDKFAWIKKLYPSCMTDERKVIIMTMSKFLTANDPIVDKAYRFISYSKTKGALVFLDEFDATKAVVLNQEIERCTDFKLNLIKLFQQLSSNLKNMKEPVSILVKPKDRPENKTPTYAYKKMKDVISSVQTAYNLDHRFKLESGEEKDKCFLFDDFSLHIISTASEEKYIAIITDNKTNQNRIRFVSKDNDKQKDKSEQYYYTIKKKDTDEPEKVFVNKENIDLFRHSIQGVKGAINYFIKFCAMISRDYLNDYNDKHNYERMNIEQAVSTVLDQFNLDENISRTLTTLIVNDMSIPMESRHMDIMRTDFYIDGFRYYDFEDDMVHNETTSISMCYFENTPEKFMLSLTNVARVVGLSATATIDSVLANYDLNYIRKKIGGNFHELTAEERARIKEEALSRMGGDYTINTEQIALSYDEAQSQLNELINQCFESEKSKEKVHGILESYVAWEEKDKFYDIARFLKSMQAIRLFIRNRQAKALLVMTNRNIVVNDSWHVFSLDVAREVIAEIAEECGERTPAIHYLQGEDFQNQKEKYLTSMAIGEKVVLFTCYNTAGSGQNLQYEYNDEVKDIDSIYIEMPTNALVHDKYLNDEVNLIKYIYQQEVLKKDGSVSPAIIKGNIITAFKKWGAPHKQQSFNGAVYNTRFVNNHHIRTLIQAVGRLCRTSNKRGELNIYIDSVIYDKIDFSFLADNNMFLNREFKEVIKQNKKTNKTSVRMIKINQALDANERALSKIGNILSDNKQSWREIDMQAWQSIREFVLRYPTIYNNEIGSAIREFSADEYTIDSANDFFLYSANEQKFNKYYYIVDKDNKDKCVDIYYDKKSGFEVSAGSSRLTAFMRIPKLKKYFTDKKYATDFIPKDAVLLPVIFKNIYMGALGEEIGRFMLEDWGIKLCDITDPLKFEKFDFYLNDAPDIYVDFKNWSEKTKEPEKENIEKARAKLKKINGKKVFIINMVADEPIVNNQGDVITISSIFRKKGFCLFELEDKEKRKIISAITEAINESNN